MIYWNSVSQAVNTGSPELPESVPRLPPSFSVFAEEKMRNTDIFGEKMTDFFLTSNLVEIKALLF